MEFWTLLVRYKKIFLAIGTTIGVYLGFRFLLPLFVPFLIASLLAWMLSPVVGFMHQKLGFPLTAAGVIALLTLSGGLFAAFFFLGRMLLEQLLKFLKNIPFYLEFLSDRIEGLCRGCDSLFGMKSGTAFLMVNDGVEGLLNTVQTELIPALTQKTIYIAVGVLGALGIVLLILVATLLLTKEFVVYKKEGSQVYWYSWIRKVGKRLSEAGIAYLRVQGILISLVAVICTFGLLLIKNEYALLLGIGIAIFDAFPVLGSGFILVPWGVIRLIGGNYLEGGVLIAIFVICQILREFLEPRLLGDKIGIRPIFSLMSMYVGLRLFGIAGFLLGPLGLVIIMTVCKVEYKK